MAFTTYPDGTDLRKFLEAHGLTVSTALQGELDLAAQAAYLDFEREAGRLMLYAGTVSARTFDPPTQSYVLYFDDADLCANPTSVVYAPTGGTSTTLVLGTDYTLLEPNALARGVPITAMRFLGRRWWSPLPQSTLQSLSITGQWGYAASLDASVWRAMLARGAWDVGSNVLGSRLAIDPVSGAPVKSWTKDGVSVTYDGAITSSLLKQWGGDDGLGGMFGSVARRFRKVAL